jgi:1A family penicillin-binding protein
MNDLPSPWEKLPPQRSRQSSPETFRQVLGQGVALGLFGSLFLLVLSVAAALGIYAYYASSLPSPEELYQRTATFKSTRIMDRHGRVLYEVLDPLGGRRTVVRVDEIPQVVIDATVATEDASFFSNPGVNPVAIARALYHDLREGELAQGASTITQQLVKTLFLTPEKTFTRKIKEAILAAEVTRRYSKAEILEVYLNEVYYGNLAYGIGAAAETYFGKHVSDLTLPEAALLTGLLQSPAFYDPYIYPEAALARRATVLRLMVEAGYITGAQAEAARREPLKLADRDIVMLAPHMVVYVREQLERIYGNEMLYKGGLQVHTTLDLDMQRAAEEIARQQIQALREQGASNAALVALDPRTGEILALLGSADFHDASISGQVNVATRLRQPGSTIKALTYLAALEHGWTPATLLMDVAQRFPDGANPPYAPTNYDGKEMGPISLRTALACSRNIPAVSTLHQIGLPALLEMSQRLGIHSLSRPDYGLSLTLGGGDVTLLEMTTAYGALANGGRRVTPTAILYITDQAGNMILERKPTEFPQAVDPRHAYLITHILADNEARLPSFGRNNPLELSFPAAAKTGTTNDYRDSWTVGYTPDLVVGVWVGNSDNTPMGQISGARGAAYIWHDYMERTLGAGPRQAFVMPPGIVEVEVCPVSGMTRTELCPPGRKELLLADQPPQPCTVHHYVTLCRFSGQLATEHCPADALERVPALDYGPEWDDWARARGMQTPPRQTCPIHATAANVRLVAPFGAAAGLVSLTGSVEINDLDYWVIEFGEGAQPGRWQALTPAMRDNMRDGALAQWDTRSVPNGLYALRLLAYERSGHRHEARALITIQNDSPTPAPTITPMPTPTLDQVAPTPQPEQVSPEPTSPFLTLPTRRPPVLR